ncbi:hypothetical protein A1O3_05220 [Capronia epimyces CBS 606.96]|uniref:Uncharacterized protein n=1 Tax=Capronia epimyces CBS 606.96 TaxID=1182542 RepID=W9Y5Q5_9EURO|nr:uncharacterized protein A1O3_05220 [Capronia epimyces CBS 606.96]EXJ84551.1 hypothetical protein A1O3_05220 [Capronia epimyces CBS 606.96]
MPHLARTFTPLRTVTVGRVFPLRSAAALHTSSARAALSEDHLLEHEDNEDRHHEIDRHKSDSVEKAKTGKGEWKPELASSSEQSVHGDKHNLTIEQMQKLGSEKSKSSGGSDSSTGTHKS